MVGVRSPRGALRCRRSGCLHPKKLVLPDRIELSTSPLPMECSTTELRQHAPVIQESAPRAIKAGRSLPQGPSWRKRACEWSEVRQIRPKSSPRPCRWLQPCGTRANRFPMAPPSAAGITIRRFMSSNPIDLPAASGIFALAGGDKTVAVIRGLMRQPDP